MTPAHSAHLRIDPRLPGLFCFIGLVGAPLSPAHGGMTVTGETITEAGPTGEAPRARFTLTNAPAQTVATTWEYATQPDTAIDGMDYAGQRGTVTLPANATTTVVEVPLIGDTWKEPAESFSLLVWPVGGTPLAGLDEIAQPATEPFEWQAGAIGVSGTSFFINRSLGSFQGGGWRHERELALPADTWPDITLLAGQGRWMTLVDSAPGAAPEGPDLTRLHIADRLSATQSPLPLDPAVHLPGSQAEMLSVLTRGNVAGVLSHGACRFYHLDPAGPPRLMGQCFLPQPKAVLFDGQRLASVSDDSQIGLQIFEAIDASLARWRLVKTLPGTHTLAALDADRLVLRRDVVGTTRQTFLHVHERMAGGVDGWGETAVLTVDDAEGPRLLGAVSLTGNLLWVGDPSPNPGSAPRPGKIHTFVKNSRNTGWSVLGTVSAPDATPGDTFGWRLAAGGTSMLTTSQPGLQGTANRAWMGTLTGGTATILDDDIPVVHVSTTSEFEPTQAERNAQGWIWLTHPLPDPVSVTWRTRSGTAVAGEDFLVREATTVIPAGAHAAAIEVTLLPDDAGEPDESFIVEIAAIGGTFAIAGPAATWIIRDTDRIPSVYAPTTHLYEGQANPTPEVRLDPAGATLNVTWSMHSTSWPSDGYPRGIDGFATAGTDFAPTTGSLQASTTSTQSLPVTTVRDGLQETTEMATLALEFNALASAASYGTRTFQALTDLPSDDFHTGNVSTDGDRVAVQALLGDAGLPRPSGVRLYVRAPQDSDGWRPDQVLRLADFGVPNLPGPSFLKLRQGRLCYYLVAAGRVWILIEDPAVPGTWKVEATFATRSSLDTGVFADADFDGDVFVTSRRSSVAGNQVYIHERGSGDWGAQQDVIVPGLSTDVRLDAHTIVALIAGSPPTPAAFAAIERGGYGAAPWVRRPDSPLPTDSLIAIETPKLHRDVAVLKRRLLEPSLILRRRDGGAWQTEQILDSDIVAVDRGVLLGRSPANSGPPVNRSFTDSGTAPNRWVLLPSTDLTLPPPYAVAGTTVFDHCRRVLVGSAEIIPFSSIEPSILGHYIAEPGADLRLVDSETFLLGAGADPRGENGTAEANSYVSLSRSPPVPFDISIPFRTISGGTATPDVDYRPVSGTIVLRGSRDLFGNSTTGFAVPILPDRLLEGPESVVIEFGTPSFGVIDPSTLMQPSTLILGIPADNRLAPAVTLPRPPVIFEPLAGQQTFTVPLRLSAAHAEPLVVGYRLMAQTAMAADAILGLGSVTVPAGILDLPVPITVLADSLVEVPETVRLSITSFNGLSVTPTHFDLTIDNAPAPGGTADAFTTFQNSPLEPSPARSLVTNDAPGVLEVTLARPAEHGVVTVLPDGTFRYEPDPNFHGLDRFAYAGTLSGDPMVGADATWRWLHPLNGQDPGITIPGFQANWMKPGFDDSSWSPGTGLMGYGTLGTPPGQLITTPIGTPTGDRYSAYFRTTFTAPAAPASGLTIEFSCDDAAIFYLNGAEIGRYAKEDPGFYSARDTYHLLSVNFHDGDEETSLRTLSAPAARLLPGVNVLAVSLHNQMPGSSDLGLRVTGVHTGFGLTPVLAEVSVTDNGSPPRVFDDSFTASVDSRPLDSRFFPTGSVYANDRLLSGSGIPYDPIVEVETGGTPIGPVTLDMATGHFRIDTPPGFFGTTAFTYRVRDKDGWSQFATVTVTANPVRNFDIWRQATFGGGFANPASLPEIDTDGDSLANLAEFAFGTNPQTPDFAPILTLERRSGTWRATFEAQSGFGWDAIIRLEASSSMTGGTWSPLALLNDQYGSIEEFAPGVTRSSEMLPTTRLRYSLDLPPSFGPATYLRLRVSRERHVMDP